MVEAGAEGARARRGWLIVGLSLALLLGVALLKGVADAGGELD